jgi:nicotinate-nucleotide--dimethylbenzimidazole phosphoribosyltransferase
MVAKIESVDPAGVEPLTSGETGDELARLAGRVCAIHRHSPPRLNRRLMLMCAADHGTVTGDDPTAGQWTSQRVTSFLEGKGSVNTVARSAGLPVRLLDVGVAGELSAHPGLIRRAVAAGTAPVHEGPAMAREQAVEALLAGYDALMEHDNNRSMDLIGVGCVSAGSLVPTLLIASHLLDLDPAALLERAGDRAIQLQQALDLHGEDLRTATALEALATVGGFDLAAMAGVYLAAARCHMATVVGGLASTTAALLAMEFCPAVAGYLFVSHRSHDSIHDALLQRLPETVLLGVRIDGGQGVGATLGTAVLASACSIWE